jgi:hypothetical protein
MNQTVYVEGPYYQAEVKIAIGCNVNKQISSSKVLLFLRMVHEFKQKLGLMSCAASRATGSGPVAKGLGAVGGSGGQPKKQPG